MAATQITVYPPDTTVVTVQTPPVVQLSIVEQLVTGAAGAVNDVLPGLGIDVTPSSGDYTVSVEFAPSGTSNATQAVRADDSRLSDARTPLAHTHAIADVTGLQAALDEALETMTKTVRKASAGTITKGQVVYIVGSTGSHLTVELADADTEATAATTIGVALNTITGTTDGEIIVQGYLDGLSNLPISGFTDGQALWLSQTAGGWTNTRPTQPAHGVFLGWVISASNGSSGRAYIKVINGQELEELHDVLISSPADNDLLAYDLTSGLWKNQTAAQAGLAAATHTHVIGDVTGLQTALDNKLDDTQASATGLSILGAADAAAVRSTLGLATTDTPVFAALELANGERIRNSTNGRVDIVPQPTGAARHGIYFNLTGVGGQVNLGTVRSTDGALNIGKIVFDATLGVGTLDFAPGLIQETFGDLTLESVGGNVNLVGTSVFINSYSVPGTIGTAGQVLTSNGINAATWQTPAAASGASKAFAVAMATAL